MAREQHSTEAAWQEFREGKRTRAPGAGRRREIFDTHRLVVKVPRDLLEEVDEALERHGWKAGSSRGRSALVRVLLKAFAKGKLRW